MGSVKRETYNYRLLDYADYSSINTIKQLFRMYPTLETMALSGDAVAICIKCDLDSCMERLCETEREAIFEMLVSGYTMREFAGRKGVSIGTASCLLSTAIKNCIMILGDKDD